MKRLLSSLLLVALISAIVSPVRAVESAPQAQPAPASDKSPFSKVATAVTTVTGIAISPLLGTGAYGAYQYFTTKDEDRAKLPWYAQISFFAPALLLVGVAAGKDTLGAVLPPGLKKPLDVLETIENKASGLVAAGAVVPLTMTSLASMIGGGGSASVDAAHSTGLAMIHLGAIDFSWLLNILTIPFGLAVFAIVWMASHAINVLILLSPWGAVDAVLKSGRTALLGLLTLSAQIKPEFAAVLSLVVIVVAYLVAGWAFRLTIFGSVFCWDFFSGAKHRFKTNDQANSMFSGSSVKGVPVRTLGKLEAGTGGEWRFTFKPWLVLAERTVVVKPAAASIGKGLFFSTIRDGGETVAILPPRYRGHEDELVRIYKIEGGVKDAGLLKAWSALRELFSGTSAQVQAS